MSMSETNKYTEQYNGKYLYHCLHFQYLFLSLTRYNGAFRIIPMIKSDYLHAIN